MILIRILSYQDYFESRAIEVHTIPYVVWLRQNYEYSKFKSNIDEFIATAT